ACARLAIVNGTPAAPASCAAIPRTGDPTRAATRDGTLTLVGMPATLRAALSPCESMPVKVPCSPRAPALIVPVGPIENPTGPSPKPSPIFAGPPAASMFWPTSGAATPPSPVPAPVPPPPPGSATAPCGIAWLAKSANVFGLFGAAGVVDATPEPAMVAGEPDGGPPGPPTRGGGAGRDFQLTRGPAPRETNVASAPACPCAH